MKEGASRSVLRGIIQYDTLNEVNIRLSDGSKAFNYEGYTNIIFKVLKADGTAYIDSEGENVIATSPVDGIVTVNLNGQATTAAGLCQSVIEIYSGEDKMTTARFNYEVFEDLDLDEAVESTAEYPALQNLLTDLSALEASIEAAEAARVTAEAARAAEASGYVAMAEAAKNAANASAVAAEVWAKQAKNIAGGNFAPSGLSIGQHTVSTDAELDDVLSITFDSMADKTVGFIVVRVISADVSIGGGTWHFKLNKNNDTTCTAEGIRYGELTHAEVRRNCYDGTFFSWEWVNPPMKAGVEYRTTERYNGKPIYTKLANLGTIAKDSCVAIKYSEDEYCRAISVGGGAPNAVVMQSGVFSSVVDGAVKDPENRIELGGYTNYVIVKTNFLISNAVVIVKYYKTTDT